MKILACVYPRFEASKDPIISMPRTSMSVPLRTHWPELQPLLCSLGLSVEERLYCDAGAIEWDHRWFLADGLGAQCHDYRHVDQIERDGQREMCSVLANGSLHALRIFPRRSGRCLQHAPISIEWIQSDWFSGKAAESDFSLDRSHCLLFD